MTEAIMQDSSLDTWDKILNDGFVGEMSMKVLELITDNPDKTVRELLKIGVDDGTYPYPDRNLIAPRVTGLVNEGIIVRPFRRICEVTGEDVLVHRLAPDEWREHYRLLLKGSVARRKIIRHRLEIKSNSSEKIKTVHTAVWWHDGAMSCTCSKTYNRPTRHRCHHIRGMYKAVTGLEMAA